MSELEVGLCVVVADVADHFVDEYLVRLLHLGYRFVVCIQQV